ncbi:hypothetical protein, variant 9 [Aphanomyces invadans]|uniref:Uncharacterized protein n=1 Tax=Aphanomyces invadans TaxID=157072 RepID=A0A024UTW2_9STRA|nr:hypothetical protein, variant 8 [Aphanomyces invadans]XP_008863163.1 hypothetical protein, variant 9 [Aphanomyces invadans]ETW09361.1 hypothetical protein, variant 8 [Aphanomyces invadans]ETW09362.1 hypothetical protein, variant 9 [Aphanomyces invadans]|eukprot:XP_008863162.1 hypothetical protein, variant 8 [Aphanomyces invadans]
MDSEHFALLDRHGRHIPRLLRPRPRWFSPKHRTESQRGIFDANQTHHSTNLDAFPTAAFRTDVLATVTSFEVPSSQHVVRIAMHDLDGAMLPPSVPRRPVPPAIFDANVIYGMFSASPYDILRRHSRLVRRRGRPAIVRMSRCTPGRRSPQPHVLCIATSGQSAPLEQLI